MAFVHIPLSATRLFQDNYHRITTNTGLNEERIRHQGNICNNQDSNCKYNGADIPFMKALVGTEGLMAVFLGHDHGVDWCMNSAKNLPNTSPSKGRGLNTCFNRHSSYGGCTNWTHRARQISVREDMLDKNLFKTWVHLENGKVAGQVTLKSTLGTDQYPTEEKSKSSAL